MPQWSMLAATQMDIKSRVSSLTNSLQALKGCLNHNLCIQLKDFTEAIYGKMTKNDPCVSNVVIIARCKVLVNFCSTKSFKETFVLLHNEMKVCPPPKHTLYRGN